jgi:hypothetical protein
VNLDEKTGKIVSTSTDCDIATNFNSSDDKMLSQKLLRLQASSSLPDLPGPDALTGSSSSTTISSNINNQSQVSSVGHGKHVILECSLDSDNFNQIDGTDTGDHQSKKKMKLNIQDPANSSSASSVNLDFTNDVIVKEISTL